MSLRMVYTKTVQDVQEMMESIGSNIFDRGIDSYEYWY